MEIIPFTAGSLKRHWKRRGYNRISPNRKHIKVVRFGGVKTKRSWKLRLAPKLKLIRLASSPLKLWYKFKNGYVNMMLRLANSGNGGKVFGEKRIPQVRDVSKGGYSTTEFENRLVFEIYKSMVASFELGYTPNNNNKPVVNSLI